MSRETLVCGYIPEFIANLEPMLSVLKSIGAESESLFTETKYILDQCFVKTAEKGLNHWENYLGIKGNDTTDDNYRRSVITAKLKGTGTTTKAMVKDMATSYENGEVEVALDSNNFIVKIKFISDYGIPANLGDFDRSLNEVIPCHLEIEYLYSYLTWQQLDSAGITWTNLDSFQFTWDELETWNPG